MFHVKRVKDTTPISVHENDIEIARCTWAEFNRCTWAEFKDENDAMMREELTEILHGLNQSGFYRGGGGAFGEYEVRREGE